MSDASPVSVICIDDNEWIGESIRRLLRKTPELVWGGWFRSTASFLASAGDRGGDAGARAAGVRSGDAPGDDDEARGGRAEGREAAEGDGGVSVILLDLDIPGEDSLELVPRLARANPSARVLVLSGHVQAEMVDRAIAAGVWGYVSKNDETHAILDAIRRVAAGEVALSPTVMEEYRQ